MAQITSILQPALQRFALAPNTATKPSAQDEAQAERAADMATRQIEGSRQDPPRRSAPELAEPVASVAGFAGLGALLPLIAGQHPAMVPGATAEAFAVLHRTAAVSAADTAADGMHPVQVVDQSRRLIGLATSDGQLALPTREDLHALRRDLPEASALLDELDQLPDEKLTSGLGSSTRTDYILLLVALLMQMGASQREQAVAMVKLAEQSVSAMTGSMVASAKATQSTKIVAAVVGGLMAGGGVALGGAAAYKGVQNLRTNKATADAATASANRANSQTAVGMNNAPAGPSARPPHVEALRQRPQTLQETAAVHETEFAVNNTQIGVVANAGQAVTQTSMSVGAVAGSPFDLQATAHTVDSERDRINKDIEVELGSKINQDANKSNESQQATFNTLVNLEQENQDGVKHVISNMGR
ncbi:hypothetical protein [Stenotrophomonas sp. CFBP 13725]|uniref:hypothetical protein n=1 Tax=Stenotrophomonas sp. CFBP 13725 TaxID=2775297 RepID=UPI00177F9EFF|nr:hypothetical protein [Stenotrophomonas sp. CFBP 13725]MBD8637740.1 hypothetical protein [Stenotrophomonas sp. CFBP 13725]